MIVSATSSISHWESDWSKWWSWKLEESFCNCLGLEYGKTGLPNFTSTWKWNCGFVFLNNLVFYSFGTTHFCTACHDDFQRLMCLPKQMLPKCPVGPKGVQLDGSECPLRVKHPATGEEFPLGCGICRNINTFWLFCMEFSLSKRKLLKKLGIMYKYICRRNWRVNLVTISLKDWRKGSTGVFFGAGNS